jgi:hypothetical protein
MNGCAEFTNFTISKCMMIHYRVKFIPSPRTCGAVILVSKLRKCVIPIFKLCLGPIFTQTDMDSYPPLLWIHNRLDEYKTKT